MPASFSNANEWALTDALLQDAKEYLKKELFGNATDNVQYAYGVKSYLEAAGNMEELEFSSWKDVMTKVGMLVSVEEN